MPHSSCLFPFVLHDLADTYQTNENPSFPQIPQTEGSSDSGGSFPSEEIMGLSSSSDTFSNAPLLLSLANWAWGTDPSPEVTPEICLDSIPFLSTPCFTRLVVKSIGIAIICASCINKAPVIANILKSHSVVGLSVAAVYGEVIMYSNAAFYNVLRGNPFTAYGETLVMVFQTMIIVGLTWWWKEDPRFSGGDIGLVVGAYLIYLFVVFQVLTPDSQYILMVYNPVVLIYSRGSQIIANYHQKQTGAQSLATTGMNFAGSLVRIATTIKEVGWDFHILRSYGTSVTLNCILLVQIVAYRSNTEKFLQSLKGKKTD